jgi:hypothetical protein
MKKNENMFIWFNIGLQIAMSGKWHKGPPMVGQCKYDLIFGQCL